MRWRRGCLAGMWRPTRRRGGKYHHGAKRKLACREEGRNGGLRHMGSQGCVCVQLQKREASCLIGHKADGNSSSDKKVQAGFPSPALPCPALPGPSGVRPGSSCFCTRWAWYGVSTRYETSGVDPHRSIRGRGTGLKKPAALFLLWEFGDRCAREPGGINGGSCRGQVVHTHHAGGGTYPVPSCSSLLLVVISRFCVLRIPGLLLLA